MNTDIVFRNENGVAVTTSFLVAETFGKEQYTVVRDIDNLVSKLKDTENQCPTNLSKHQIMFSAYYEDIPQPCGGTKPAKRYFMNRDGFTLLVMGYTGQKALEFKLKYIAAFNAMERTIQHGSVLSQQFMEMQMQMMNQMMNLCNTMMQRIERMESVSQPKAEPAFSAEIPKEETPIQQPLYRPTKYGRYVMNLYDVRMFYPSYLKVYDAATVLRTRGLAVYQTSLFAYLRKKGYICIAPDRYNRPSEECEKNGWMISTWAGDKKGSRRRCFVPYINPVFIDILEKEIREDVNGISELSLFSTGKEVEP